MLASVRMVLGMLGLGILVTAGIAAIVTLVVLALLIAPALVALAWNVLDFGDAIGAGSLSFWGCVLLGWFLASPFPIRFVIVAVVFIADPAWFHAAGELHWPEPTFRNFVAVVILLIVLSFSAGHGNTAPRKDRQPPASGARAFVLSALEVGARRALGHRLEVSQSDEYANVDR